MTTATKPTPPGFSLFKTKAKRLIKSRLELGQLIHEALRKADKNTKIRDFLRQIKQLIRLLKAWSQGYYQIPKNTAIIITACLLYFVVPFDLIPDFIIKLGFIDDIAVIGFVISEIQEELDNFAQFEKSADSTSHQ